VVGPIHPKAMPVILTKPEEIEAWMTAPAEEALKLQRPLPDGFLGIVARGEKKDELALRSLGGVFFSRARSPFWPTSNALPLAVAPKPHLRGAHPCVKENGPLLGLDQNHSFCRRAFPCLRSPTRGAPPHLEKRLAPRNPLRCVRPVFSACPYSSICLRVAFEPPFIVPR
jgi:hypothetical protein